VNLKYRLLISYDPIRKKKKGVGEKEEGRRLTTNAVST
jgi:hypothetical protein